MSFRFLMSAAAAALTCAPALAQQSATEPATAAQHAAARYSPERLAAIRSALTSRIAVYDAGEKAMRRPTAAEAAALAPAPSNAAPRYVMLPSGGVALRQDASSVDYLIVDIAADGKKTTRHGSADSVGTKPASKQEAHRHAH